MYVIDNLNFKLNDLPYLFCSIFYLQTFKVMIQTMAHKNPCSSSSCPNRPHRFTVAKKVLNPPLNLSHWHCIPQVFWSNACCLIPVNESLAPFTTPAIYISIYVKLGSLIVQPVVCDRNWWLHIRMEYDVLMLIG